MIPEELKKPVVQEIGAGLRAGMTMKQAVGAARKSLGLGLFAKRFEKPAPPEAEESVK